MGSEHLFQKEVTKTVGLIRDEISTHIADVGGGRDYVLDKVTSTLERLGFQVLRITCLKSLSKEPLAALKLSSLWGAAGLQESDSIGKAILRCCEVILGDRHSVISIANLEWVDTQTWAAIETIRMRTGITLLTAGNLPARARREGACVLSDIAWPSAEVIVENLPYTTVNAIVEHRLGNPADRDLVRRLFVDTQGQYTLVLHMLESIKRMGRIALHNGRWSAVGELWNQALREYLDSYLSTKPSEVQEELEVLAILGLMEREEAERSFSDESLQVLEEEGLISNFKPGDVEFIQVIPPVIARYFTERVSKSRRKQILDSHFSDAGASIGVTQGQSWRSRDRLLAWPPSHPVLSRSRSERVTLAKILRNHWLAVQEELRSAWENNPNQTTAFNYLQVLTLWDDSSDEVSRVLRQAQLLPGPPDIAVRVAVFNVQWEFFCETSPEEIVRFTRKTISRYPEHVDLIAGNLLYLADLFWPDVDAGDLLQQLGLTRAEFNSQAESQNHFFGLAARASVKTSGADANETKRWKVQSEHQPIFSARDTMVAQINDGGHVRVTGQILDLLNQSLNDLDVQRIIWHSYGAVNGLYFMGKIREVKGLLETVFALEPPSSICRFHYKSLLHINAVLAYRSGNTTAALRLIDHAESLGVGEAGISAGAREIPEAVKLLIAQEAVKADAVLLSGIGRCLDNNWDLEAFF